MLCYWCLHHLVCPHMMFANTCSCRNKKRAQVLIPSILTVKSIMPPPCNFSMNIYQLLWWSMAWESRHWHWACFAASLMIPKATGRKLGSTLLGKILSKERLMSQRKALDISCFLGCNILAISMYYIFWAFIVNLYER